MRYIIFPTSLFVGYFSVFTNAQNIPTDSSTIALNEVVVSPNKVEETTKTIAQQVQVLNAAQIRNLQAQSTADLVANTGNVFVQKSQAGGGSITLRGFEANRTLLVIDGVRMNNLIYRSGHLQNIITTDNNSLDRVEILFGPSSTIYGSDALGGVVHLYTKKPTLATLGNLHSIKANAFSRYGTVNNELTNHLNFNLGNTKLASLTSLTVSEFGDLRGGANQNPFYESSYGERPVFAQRINGKDSLVKNSDRYLQTQSGYKQYDAVQKFLYQPNERTTHLANFQYSTSSNIPRYDRLTDPAGKGLRFSQWYYGPQTRWLGAYDMNLKNPQGAFQGIHLGINYQHITESRHTRRFNNLNLNHRNERVQVWGVNLDFHKIIHHHDIRFGLDGQYNILQSTANIENIATGISQPLDTRYPDGANSMTNTALYFSHTWQWNDQLALVDGLRVGFASLQSSFVDTTFFKFPYKNVNQNNPVFSGNLGIIHNPTDAWKLSLLVSTGYRVPNIDDLSKVFESGSGRVIVPNNNLKPERTINTELAITNIFENKTRLENVVYYTQFVDAIVTDKYQYNGKDSLRYDGITSRVYANQNKQNAYIYGFSSNLKSQCNEHISLSMAVNYTYGRIKTDSSDVPLDHIPPLMMRLALNYKYKKFNTDLFVNYNGWKRLKDYYLNGEDNEQYATPRGMPAWFTLNVRASYQLHSLLALQTGIDNVFDTQYRTFASGINAPGRNIFFAVRFSY
ncbi:MAG: TonB-dependent receptor [Cytophagales bacterium]|nr:MAG: TonB-dependent receptor [Cytophagales bacterium]